jgi:ATP-dependent DNA helicase RecG
MNILDLLRQPEGKTLEFKRDLSSPRNILRTIVAFANSAGGTIVIGVEDKSRAMRGVDDVAGAEERLVNMIVDSIAPRLVPSVRTDVHDGNDLLIVRVPTGGSPPYRLASEGEPEGVYVRIGSTNRHVDQAYVRELARFSSGVSFDSEPMQAHGPETLDIDAIAARFAGVRPIGPAEVATLRLVTGDAENRFATVGGTLLFGRQREFDFPDACIWAARFKGASRTTFVDAKEFSGPLIDQIDLAMQFVERNTSLRYIIQSLRRENRWEFPLDAIREAITNAVLHADYSRSSGPIRVAIYDDRIEIENPGMLVPGLSIDDVVSGGSWTRNRVISRVFRELHLVELWGSGVGRMIDTCRAAGLPDPQFEEIALHFRVTIRNSHEREPALDAMDATILESLKGTDGLSTSEIAELVGRTPRSVRTRVARLIELGLLTELSSGPNDPHRKFFAAEDRAAYRAR